MKVNRSVTDGGYVWGGCLICMVVATLFGTIEVLAGDTSHGAESLMKRSEPPSMPILRIETDLHSGNITGLDIDAEERFVVTSSTDKTVRVWELTSGKLLQTLRPPIAEGTEGIIRAVAISPNGKTVVCAGDIGFAWEGAWVIYVFDRATGALMNRITGLPQAAVQLAFSRDGEVLAAGLKGKNGIRVYQATDYQQIGEDHDYGNSNYDGTVTGLAFDDAGNLVTVALDEHLRRYDYRVHLLEKRKAYVDQPSGVAISSDGNLIAISSSNSTGVRQLERGKKGFADVPMDRGQHAESFGGLVAYAKNGKLLHNSGFMKNGDSSYVHMGGELRVQQGMFENVGVVNLDGVGYIDQRFPFPITAGVDSISVYLPSRPIVLRALRDGGLVYGTADGFGVLRPKEDPNPGRDTGVALMHNDTGRIIEMMTEVWISKTLCCGRPIGSLRVSQDSSIVEFSESSGSLEEQAKFVLVPIPEHGFTKKEDAWIPNRFTAGNQDKKQRWRFNLTTRLLTESNEAEEGKGDDFQPPRTIARGFQLANWKEGDSPILNEHPVPLVKGERSRAIAITRDGKVALMGTTHFLRSLDRDGSEHWRTAVESGIRDINVSSDGTVAVAAHDDGTIRWFRLRDGAPLLNLFPHGGRGVGSIGKSRGSIGRANERGATPLLTQVPLIEETRWILWTPSGYFDASERAEDLIGWHVNQGKEKEGNYFPASHFFEQLYRPDVLQEVLRTKGTDREVLERLKHPEHLNVPRGFKLPPKVTIHSPSIERNGERLDLETYVDQEDLELVVQADNQGGGVDAIRLFQNGKVIDPDSGTETSVKGQPLHGAMVTRFRVRLIEGRNAFRAVAFSRDRIESHPAETTVFLKAKGASASLHLFLVGINEYRNSSFNLRYALPDAQGIAKIFEGKSTQLYKTVRLYEIYDKAATKSGILERMRQVESSNPQDVVIIYFSGHGESIGDTWYFIPHEITNPERDEVLKAQALSSTELRQWITKVKAQKVLVFMDSCKSGAAMAAFGGRGIEDRLALAQLARATGTHIVAASTSQQEAMEVKKLGHGLFTYALLQGLQGEADGGANKDGVVSVRELLAYVEKELPLLTAKYKGKEQFPVADSRGMDFPLALVP